MYIPYYICPVIKQILRDENCSINFYHINKNFYPINTFPKQAYILYPNYFGICYKNVYKLEQKYENLIIDNAHSFFAKPVGLASFTSLRKFFQVKYSINDGAYLYIKKIIGEKFLEAENYEVTSKFDYEQLVKNENRLDSQKNIMTISKRSGELINTIDFEYEKKQRIEKFKYFDEIYKSSNELCIDIDFNEDIPFVYPYLINDEKIGFELEKQGLQIFRYWHGIPKNFEEYYFYKYLIPIPLV